MRARKVLAVTAVVVGCSALPASAFAGKAIVRSTSNPGGGSVSVALGCTVVNLPGTVTAQTITVPYSAAEAAAVDKVLTQLGVKVQLPAGSGILTISIAPGDSCGSSTGTPPA